jgi:hypothetical protein
MLTVAMLVVVVMPHFSRFSVSGTIFSFFL